MLIYEVNLDIDPEVYDQYVAWLMPHVKEMLTYAGFIEALVQKDTERPNHLTVSYRLRSEADLNDYLEHHAHTMREDGLKRFLNQFRANRRILAVSEHLLARSVEA